MAFSFKQTISFTSLLLLHFTCSNSSPLSHDQECLALLEFKQSILHQDYDSFDAGGFHKLDTWRNSTSTASDYGFDCCLWGGVVCSKEGQVIELDLSQSSLRGRLKSNSTLFDLVHLQILNLSMNDFVESEIPSDIVRLKHLRILNLSNSGFSGQIPKEISHLVKLSSLDLSWNPLKLQSPSLKYLLQNLTGLEELHLSGINIDSSVPHFLANFSSLRSIKFYDCHLQDEFPSPIFHLPKLIYLNLANNPNLFGSMPEFHNTTLLEKLRLFSTGFAGIIPESISKLNHLESLDLSNSSFSGRIPSSLSNLTQLTTLYLDKNNFTGPVPSLERLSKLIYLALGNNNFEKGRILHWIGNLVELEDLYVSYMNIYEEIPPSLTNCTKLSSIVMHGNLIFGGIPSSFMNLTTLTVVDLGANQLQGPISSAFSTFKSLKYLHVGINNFSGRVDLDTFIGLNELEELNLGHNNISCVSTNNYTDDVLPELNSLSLQSCNLKEFPPFLRFQKKMNYLFLQDNKIEGLIPEWVWKNSQETLVLLGLSDNFITGFHQHPHFLPWVRLEVFDFNNNRLQGQLPVPPQTMIIYDVSDNYLTGEISPLICGVYPHFLPCISLEVFDISNNHLQGQLPVPPQTTIIYDVSNNYLTGEIPPLICQVKTLQYLDLSSNNMIGILPPCLGTLSNSLLVLDLKRNNFHGPMLNTCTHGSPVKRIDLSTNRFTGQLSKSLANCKNLEVLVVADNSFDGIFPFWLGNLAKLQVLILRSNKFYGSIQDLTSVSSQFLKLRIIDLSNNDFSGQLPDKYFRNWNSMKSRYFGESSAMGFRFSFGTFSPVVFPYSITLTNKGVKTDYQNKILNIFTAIDLSSNNFEGEIPRSLQDLKGLQSLNLSNNRLTGRILPSLGNLTNIESLDLSQNELSGEIPQHLLQLSFLAIFNVSFNYLEGRIPQGKQFNTFDNSSYKGNPGLCGQPLAKDCQSSKVSTLPETSNEYDSLLPNERIDWIIIFLGVGTGLAIGIVFGNILYAKHNEWVVEFFGMRKDKWVRPLSNRRRN